MSNNSIQQWELEVWKDMYSIYKELQQTTIDGMAIDATVDGDYSRHDRNEMLETIHLMCSDLGHATRMVMGNPTNQKTIDRARKIMHNALKDAAKALR